MSATQLCVCLVISVLGSSNQIHVAGFIRDSNGQLFCGVSKHGRYSCSGLLRSKPTKLIDPSKAQMRPSEFDGYVTLFYISCNVGFPDRYKIRPPFSYRDHTATAVIRSTTPCSSSRECSL